MAYHRYHGVNTHIIRIFNTYGERMRLDDGRVVPNFMGQALRGEPLTVYGDGSQTRSFCYVADLVEGISGCCSPISTSRSTSAIPNEVTILEFAQEILEAVRQQEQHRLSSRCRRTTRSVRRPDITRARTATGLGAEDRRREGMRRTLEFFRTSVKQ